MTRAEFQAAYPALATASNAQIDSALSLAAVHVSSITFSATYTLAFGLCAAHYLSMAPGGVNAKVNPKGPPLRGFEQTTYGQQYMAVRNQATALLRVFPLG